MPRFITDGQRDAYKAVARALLRTFGDAVEASLEAPAFSLASGSARVEVGVMPWRDTALIKIRALLIENARVDFDLLDFLLRENQQLDLGGFALDGAGGVFFQHTILGSGVSEDVVRTSVQTVMLVADQYDDRIQQRWGGRRSVDTSPRTQGFRPRKLQVKAQTGADTCDETLQFDAEDLDC